MFGTRKLGKTSAQRKAMLRQQVTDLLENGKMETTFYRAKEVQPVVEKMITCLGQNTLAVVILHFLCFKLVSLVGVLIQGQPIYLIAAFPILYEGIIWCIAYLLCGLGVPVALSIGWKKYLKINYTGKV